MNYSLLNSAMAFDAQSAWLGSTAAADGQINRASGSPADVKIGTELQGNTAQANLTASAAEYMAQSAKKNEDWDAKHQFGMSFLA